MLRHHHKRSNAVNISRPTLQGSSVMPLADAILTPNPRVLNMAQPPKRTRTPNVNLDAMRRLEGVHVPKSNVQVVMGSSPTDSPTLKRYRQPRILAPVNRGSPSRRRHAAATPRHKSSATTYHASPGTSPKRYKAHEAEHGVELALDDLLHSLKAAAALPGNHGRSNGRTEPLVSVWSSSSDESDVTSPAFTWFSRKSSLDKRSSHRSRPSRDTTASSHRSHSSHDSTSTIRTATSHNTKSHRAATSGDSTFSHFATSLKSKSSMASLKSKTSLASLRSTRSGKHTNSKREKTTVAAVTDDESRPLPPLPILPSAPSSTWLGSAAPEVAQAPPQTQAAVSPLYPPPTTAAATCVRVSSPASVVARVTPRSTRNKLVQELVARLRTKRSRSRSRVFNRPTHERFTMTVAAPDERHIPKNSIPPASSTTPGPPVQQGSPVSRPSSTLLGALSHTSSLEQPFVYDPSGAWPKIPPQSEERTARHAHHRQASSSSTSSTKTIAVAPRGPSPSIRSRSSTKTTSTGSSRFTQIPSRPMAHGSAYSPYILDWDNAMPGSPNSTTSGNLAPIAGRIGSGVSQDFYKDKGRSGWMGSSSSQASFSSSSASTTTKQSRRLSTGGRTLLRLSTSPSSFSLRSPFRRSHNTQPPQTPPMPQPAMVLVTPHRFPVMRSEKSLSKAEAILGVRLPRANTDFVCEETVSIESYDSGSDSDDMGAEEEVTIATPRRGLRATATTIASRPSSARGSPSPSPSGTRQPSPTLTPDLSFTSLSEISDMTNYPASGSVCPKSVSSVTSRTRSDTPSLSPRRLLHSLKRRAARPATALTIDTQDSTPVASPLATPVAVSPQPLAAEQCHGQLADVIERNFTPTHPFTAALASNDFPTALRPPRTSSLRTSPTPSVSSGSTVAKPAAPIPISRAAGLPPHHGSLRKGAAPQWPEWPPRWDSPGPILPSSASVHTFGASCRSRRSSFASSVMDFSQPRPSISVDSDDEW